MAIPANTRPSLFSFRLGPSPVRPIPTYFLIDWSVEVLDGARSRGRSDHLPELVTALPGPIAQALSIGIEAVLSPFPIRAVTARHEARRRAIVEDVDKRNPAPPRSMPGRHWWR